MSPVARKSCTVGEIVNLMSVDTNRFTWMTHYVHDIYFGPLHAMVAMYLIWQEIGPAVFAGFFAILLLFPVHVCLLKIKRNTHVSILTHCNL